MNHYDVLGLRTPEHAEASVTQREVKQAYRQALLKYHPDKAQPIAETSTKTGQLTAAHCSGIGATKPTVDEITTAFQTLSDPKARGDHDRELRLRSLDEQKAQRRFHTGLETVDLDDLAHDDDTGVWYRQCRCGQERGYLITEQQLEEVADEGEIVMGCRGCSLWLKALFGVAEEDA